MNDKTEDYLLAEFLQSLALVGLSPSLLHLISEALIVLLRSLHTKEGLRNGTRVVLANLFLNCIEAKILGGRFNGRNQLLQDQTDNE